MESHRTLFLFRSLKRCPFRAKLLCSCAHLLHFSVIYLILVLVLSSSTSFPSVSASSSFPSSLYSSGKFVVFSLCCWIRMSDHNSHVLFNSDNLDLTVREARQQQSCPHPSVPLYAQVTLSDEIGIRPGSTANYKCDDGYELFGSSVRTCSSSGKWSGDLPYCGSYLTQTYYSMSLGGNLSLISS